MAESNVINGELYVNVERYADNTVLFDFLDAVNYEKFLNVLGDLAPNSPFTHPSMVLIQNYAQRRLSEGTTYNVSLNVLNALAENGQIALHQFDSYIIGYEIRLNGGEDPLFLKSRAISNYVRQVDEDLSEIDFAFNEQIQVSVRNVGQGSWNEISNGERVKLLFDMGTAYTASKTFVRELVDERIQDIQKDQPGLIISHWDVDHYHCLKSFSESELSKLGFVICRNNLPNLTSQSVFDSLQNALEEKVFPIAAFEKPREKLKHCLLKRLNSGSGNLLIYNGCEHRNRNQSAICCVVRNKNTSVVLSADLHYNQVSECILPDLGFQNKHYLVVPHHGGKAGKFVYDLNNGVEPHTAIISVGKNSYGHPLEKYIRKLKATGFKVKQTRFLGSDYKIVL